MIDTQRQDPEAWSTIHSKADLYRRVRLGRLYFYFVSCLLFYLIKLWYGSLTEGWTWSALNAFYKSEILLSTRQEWTMLRCVNQTGKITTCKKQDKDWVNNSYFSFIQLGEWIMRTPSLATQDIEGSSFLRSLFRVKLWMHTTHIYSTNDSFCRKSHHLFFFIWTFVVVKLHHTTSPHCDHLATHHHNKIV